MGAGSLSAKNILRQEIRHRLKTLGPTHRLQNALRLTEHILEFPAWQQARSIGLFASLPSEPETRTLMKHAWSAGKQVALPRIHDSQGLTLHRVHSPNELQRGPQGFDEPKAETPTVPLAELDMILVPGVAYDRFGGRMGRGGGYYDRLLGLPECRALLLGVFFSAQEVPRCPQDPWDRPLQWIVTEEECFRALPEGPMLSSS